ncbi:MAG: class II aldolase/adducin family protein [Tissierellia bacterium]|nr:class II aldolase/adducin family protein [Tissierellia bacterium]
MNIIEGGKELLRRNLTFGTGGNLSERKKDGFLITPSGISYDCLEEKDLVLMDMEGSIVHGIHKPSSEWEMHRQIYRNFYKANAVVHTHSKYVNILACTGESLPAIHYLLASVGGNSVDIAPYHTYGTKELAEDAVKYMGNKKAVILANHGLITWGDSIKEALDIAETVEFCSFLYVEASTFGTPTLISNKEMELMLEKFQDYGPGKR